MSEQGTEPSNHLVYQFNQFMERWQKRFTLRRPALLKRYIEGELGLHIHFRTAFSDGVTSDYCAVFERANGARVANGEFENVCVFYGVGIRDGATSNGPDSEVEQLVLVPDIELVKKEQELPFTPIRSLVGLNVLNRCNDIVAGSLYLCSTGGFKFVGVIDDGERRTTWTRLGRTSVVQYQLPSEVVEGRAQMVNDFPGHDSPSYGRFLRNPRQVDVLSGCRVRIGSNAVRVEFPKRLEFTTEVLEVLLGPLDPGTTSF